MSERTCLCGRRIVRDRAGILHDQCGTCRRMAGELEFKLVRRPPRLYRCRECGRDGLPYHGRGRTPEICPACRPEYDRKYQQDYAHRRRRPAGR